MPICRCLGVEVIKKYTVCFTGHRYIPAGEYESISSGLEKTVRELIQRGYLFFATGGALGFDTLAAQTILKLKDEFPAIKLYLVLPCLTQTRSWKKEDIDIYEQIKTVADNVTYTSYEYTRGCMFKRNRTLVEMSALCVCFLRKSTGGTAYTVKYAKAKNLKIIAI